MTIGCWHGFVVNSACYKSNKADALLNNRQTSLKDFHSPESTSCTRRALFYGPAVDGPPRQAWRPPASHYAAGKSRRIWSLAGDCSSAGRTAAQTLSVPATTQTTVSDAVAAAAYFVSRQQQRYVGIPTRYQQCQGKPKTISIPKRNDENTLITALFIAYWFLFSPFCFGVVAVAFFFALIKIYVQYFFWGRL